MNLEFINKTPSLVIHAKVRKISWSRERSPVEVL